MIELIYASTRPRETTDRVVVDDIVLPAMRFNRAHDITGCLWFGPTRFLQVLEGPEQTIAPLYDRIVEDKRHENVHLIHTTPVATRSFERWSMKLIQGNEFDTIEELITEHMPEPRKVKTPSPPTPSQQFIETLRTQLLALVGNPAV